MTADIKLPPLPDPLVMVNRYGHGASTSDGDGGVFTAEQLRAYATAAVLADRERTEGVMRMALEALTGSVELVSDRCGWQHEMLDALNAHEAAIAALREHLKESK